MDRQARRQRWAQVAEEAFTGVAAWRSQHPTATFREIEAAVDERLAAVRARMLADAAPPRPASRCRPAPDHPWRRDRIGRGHPRHSAATAA